MPRRMRAMRKRRKVKKPMDYIKVKLTRSTFLETRGNTGEISAYCNARNLAITYVQDSTQPTQHVPLDNYAKWMDLFDSYRVQYIRLEYTPAVNTTANLSTQMPPVYVAFDVDNAGSSNLDEIMSNRTCRQYDLKRKWVYKVKIPKYTDDNNPKGWQNLQATSGNFTGTINIVSDGLVLPAPENPEPIGSLRLIYVVEFNRRTDRNVPAYFGVDKQGKTLDIYPTMKLSNPSFLEQQGDGDNEYFEFNN